MRAVSLRDLAALGLRARHIAGEKAVVLSQMMLDPELEPYIPDGSVVPTGRVKQLLFASGMLSLVGGERVYEIGDDTTIAVALSDLQNGAQIDLVGTASSLDFQEDTGTAPSDFAMWCVSVDEQGAFSLKQDYHDNYMLYRPSTGELTLGPGCGD